MPPPVRGRCVIRSRGSQAHRRAQVRLDLPFACRGSGAPDRIRTCDLRLRRPTLYPLSYRRACWAELARRGRCEWYTRDRCSSFRGTPARRKAAANGRRPPPKRGPSLLPDSLTARASFTHGFPHYPNPNLPMALRPVVNRCANSTDRIDRLFPLDKGFFSLDSFTLQSASPRIPVRARSEGLEMCRCGTHRPAKGAPRRRRWRSCAWSAHPGHRRRLRMR